MLVFVEIVEGWLICTFKRYDCMHWEDGSWQSKAKDMKNGRL
jgi:hypothetical protein